MLEWVKAQGGNINHIPVAQNKITILAPITGYISNIDALKIGKLARKLGAGRLNKDDKIDLTVGIVLKHKVGDYIEKGQPLVDIFYNQKQISEEEILSCYTFQNEKVNPPKLIIDIIKPEKYISQTK